MTYLIVNTKTWRNQRDDRAPFESLRAARTSFTRGQYDPKECDIMSYDEYRAGDTQVEVINRMSGKACLINRSQVGTCCDPSTERYWSM